MRFCVDGSFVGFGTETILGVQFHFPDGSSVKVAIGTPVDAVHES